MIKTSTNKTGMTETTKPANSMKLIPILSAIGGALLIMRAIMPAEAAPVPCKGFSASIAQTHCSVAAKAGL